MDGLKNAIQKLMNTVNGKIYGDNFIGYRIQGVDGKYYDEELHEIYDRFECGEDCSVFNSICCELKSGDHNW